MATEEEDLYKILSVSRGATKAEIKKAYHRAALTSHPDKVPEDERAAADIRFKSISRAYEILSSDDTRALYDEHGMSAFDGSSGPGGAAGGPDLDDILAQMFGGMGGGFSGMHGSFGGPGAGTPPGARRRRKGDSEQQDYEVSLEELYTGKTTKFASTKNVVCATCSGSGGREGKKGKKCGSCDGKGAKVGLRQVGPGLVTQETIPCSTCSGRGSYFVDKDKCKKCKGARVISQRKILELYVPRGARQGDKIVLAGEADQDPNTDEPGDIIFTVTEKSHETFERAGADLTAEIKISLAEALTGLDRVVVRHLDGRGVKAQVSQPRGRVMRPGEVLKVKGEGMPIKRSDQRGDLYLVVDVVFPEDGWLASEAAVKKVQDVLPKDAVPVIEADSVEEVDFEVVDSLEGFGADSDDPRAGGAWEDDDMDDEPGQPQCQQQ